MRITNGIDRLMRTLRTAPLRGSLAGEPGLGAWPDTDMPATLDVDDAEARGRATTDSESLEAGSASAPVSGLEPAAPEPEPTSAQNGPAPTWAGAESAGGASGEIVGANGTRAEAKPAEPGPAGELETVAAPSVAPEATALKPVEHPTSLDAHALARLEAASDLVESLGLGFHLGGAVERIVRGASEGKTGLEALREASWLIERYIALVEQRPVGADLHAASVRLNRAGEALAGLRAISAALETERAPASALPTRYEVMASEPPGKADPAPPTVEESASAPEVAPDEGSFGHEVALMAVRWTIMVVSVIAVVLAVTLIGEWL